MADIGLQVDPARANALREIERLADGMRTALRRIHSLAAAIDEASETFAHGSEVSNSRLTAHLAAFDRVDHYRALIEDLTESVDDHGEQIESLCSLLKRREQAIEPQDDRAAMVTAARSRWGLIMIDREPKPTEIARAAVRRIEAQWELARTEPENIGRDLPDEIDAQFCEQHDAALREYFAIPAEDLWAVSAKLSTYLKERMGDDDVGDVCLAAIERDVSNLLFRKGAGQSTRGC